MTYYDLPAPAKLNLFLHVVGQRPDGYHLLESVFRLISIADSITLELRTDGVVSRETDMADAAPEADDLVVKAAKHLQQQTGTTLGAHVVVRKRIPSGGGLGGGSSDAATVLLGLNRMWRTGLKRADLMRLGLQLGADVPFFLFGQTAFVSGIGEQLHAIRPADSSYLVFEPASGVPTATIFRDPHLTRDTDLVKISDFSGRSHYLGENGFGRNDLEPVTRRLFHVVDNAMRWVSDQGLQVRLSGSGCCFFSEQQSPADAELAQAGLMATMPLAAQDYEVGDQVSTGVLRQVVACDGLEQHPLAGWVQD